MKDEWKHKVLNVTEREFEALALEVFRFQYENNSVYQAYVKALGIRPGSVRSISKIPFLPIRFFKTHEIKTTSFVAEEIFESSGTTFSVNSKHYLKSTAWYEQVFLKAFEQFYGSPWNYCIIGLLPSYLERKNSSLVYMVNKLIQMTTNLHSGFYLYDHDQLAEMLFELEENKQKTLLIGVTFALLDFAERKSLNLKNTIIMETGGMKGRKEEMIREEVHEKLKKAFGASLIHSEYGMTELLSQAYSNGNGVFKCPPWMKVLIRDDEDPLTVHSQQSAVRSSESRVDESTTDSRPPAPNYRLSTTINGAINIIDLANIYSCSFIATDDAGRLYSNGSFEILGRMDGSDLRGCSLLTV
jgi:phenylacetate-coenzyme A ligase PaaK-like adenylate-forming protein